MRIITGLAAVTISLALGGCVVATSRPSEPDRVVVKPVQSPPSTVVVQPPPPAVMVP